MLVPRFVLGLVLILVALVLQVTVFARLPWPGVSPDLVLLVAVSLALVHGPLTGAVTGFLAGLTLDLAPPADTVAGRSALVLCLVGYVAGLMRKEAEDSVVASLAVVVGGAVVATAGYALLGALMGDPRVTWTVVWQTLPATVAYDVVLGPFVVPVVMALSRRAEPGAMRR
ncbi:MAG: rod shape-determining protein MreD [Actinomycetes bacterium]